MAGGATADFFPAPVGDGGAATFCLAAPVCAGAAGFGGAPAEAGAADLNAAAAGAGEGATGFAAAPGGGSGAAALAAESAGGCEAAADRAASAAGAAAAAGPLARNVSTFWHCGQRTFTTVLPRKTASGTCIAAWHLLQTTRMESAGADAGAAPAAATAGGRAIACAA